MIISSSWVNLGHLAHAQHTKMNCVPQGFSSLQRSVCALSTIRVGASTSCALENASDLIKPIWRRKTQISWELQEESRSFYILLHRSITFVCKHKGYSGGASILNLSPDVTLTVGPEELYVLSLLQSTGKNVLFVQAIKALALKAAAHPAGWFWTSSVMSSPSLPSETVGS